MRSANFGAITLLVIGGVALGDSPRPVANARPDEPLAKTFSLDKGAEFLDSVTLAWVRKNQCFSCHTGYPYMLARTSVGDPKAAGMLEARKFLEDRVAA